MIPILFPADFIYTGTPANGLGRLPDCKSCVITEERNGEYTLEMEYPLDGLHADELAAQKIIMALAGEKTGLQCFRIVRIKPNMKTISVYANHVSYDLSYYPVAPFSFSGGPGVRVLAYINKIWENQVNAADFNVSAEDVGAYPIPTSWGTDVPVSTMAMLGREEDSILSSFGGEFEWDNWTVKWSSARGTDNGVTISYGKNLMSFEQETNIAETVCGLLPYWSGSGTTVVGDPQYSSNASSFPFMKVKPYDFSSLISSQPTKSDLNFAGSVYVTKLNIGVPEVSTEIEFYPLWQTPEYEKFAALEKVGLCDTVTVNFPALNVHAKAKVVKTIFNTLLERYESITLGSVKQNLADTIAALM